MNSLLSEASTLIKEIERAYLEARTKWTGCDWPTAWGKLLLNLNGLRASQAFLLARATAGGEAAEWRAAAGWLSRIEQDALDAETAAERAITLARFGRLQEALAHAQRAYALEATYHNSPIWQPLREAIEAASRRARANNETS
jgi:hypothetical protein